MWLYTFPCSQKTHCETKTTQTNRSDVMLWRQTKPPSGGWMDGGDRSNAAGGIHKCRHPTRRQLTPRAHLSQNTRSKCEYCSQLKNFVTSWVLIGVFTLLAQKGLIVNSLSCFIWFFSLSLSLYSVMAHCTCVTSHFFGLQFCFEFSRCCCCWGFYQSILFWPHIFGALWLWPNGLFCL